MKTQQSWVEIYEERREDLECQGFLMRIGRVVHARRWNVQVPRTGNAEKESLALILMVCVSAREVKEGMPNGVLPN
jgi:hypothetical protein